MTEEEIEKIKAWVLALPIDTTLDEHVMREKHGFNKKCGGDCILQVANNLRAYSPRISENGVPCIRGTGKCKHDCLAEVVVNPNLWTMSSVLNSALSSTKAKISTTSYSFANPRHTEVKEQT